MELMLIIAAMLFGSVALGFALNRFVLVRITSGPRKAIALAASRAVFYAPLLVEVGHGIHLPFPLLIALAYSVREFGPELEVLNFLLPIVVFLGSLADGLEMAGQYGGNARQIVFYRDNFVAIRRAYCRRFRPWSNRQRLVN